VIKNHYKKLISILIILSILLISLITCTLPTAGTDSKSKTETKTEYLSDAKDGSRAETTSAYTADYGSFKCFWLMATNTGAETSRTNDHDYILAAGMQSRNGGDTSSLRFDDTSSKIKVLIEEEQSYDTEIAHTSEIVGGFLINKGIINNKSGHQIGYSFYQNVKQDSKSHYYWNEFDWPESCGEPVVFATLRTNNGTTNSVYDPAHVRIIKVERTNNNTKVKISYRIEEWDYQDGVHVSERIDFVVLGKGIHIVGTVPNKHVPYMLEVGTYTPPDIAIQDREVGMLTRFYKKPLVITQAQYQYNNSNPIVTRNSFINISDDTFKVRYEEQEARWNGNDQAHYPELIGYLAIGQVDRTYGSESNSDAVAKYGHLMVNSANKLSSEKNGGYPMNPLKGMSLFWLNWEDGYKFLHYELIDWLVYDWKIDILRFPVGALPIDPDGSGNLIEPITGIIKEARDLGGYTHIPETKTYQRITHIIDRCIDRGIYVIVDWHVHDALYVYNGHSNTDYAYYFFKCISEQYGDKPNIIYEIWNEPGWIGHNKNNDLYTWDNNIKPYCIDIIKAIRENDPDNHKNIIICPAPCWDQDLQQVYNNPIIGNDFTDPDMAENIMYSFHFYAGTHTPRGYNPSDLGLPDGNSFDPPIVGPSPGPGNFLNSYYNDIPIFVTEWGTTLADGGQVFRTNKVFKDSSNAWLTDLENKNISWCNWSIGAKNEGSAAVVPDASYYGFWSKWALTESGRYVRDKIRE